MGLISAVKNFVSLGGHSKLEAAGKAYEYARGRYQSAYAEAVSLKAQVDAQVSSLGKETKSAMGTLKKAHSLLSANKGYVRRLTGVSVNGVSISLPGLERARIALSGYSSGGALLGGAGLGSTAAAGSWALVSILGSASTGTAISTLSGAAAYNATVAWFGGGALAAGGAGMAGGALMLTGIAIVPMVAFAAWTTRSKAKELDEARAKVDAATSELGETSRKLSALLPVVGGARRLLGESAQSLRSEEAVTRRILYPHGWLSRIWWAIKSMFGRAVLTDTQVAALKRLDDVVDRFSSMFFANRNDLAI